MSDGSVVIDTKIDQSGFNAGMKKLQASAAGALNTILFQVVRIGSGIRGVLEGVVSSGVAVLKKLIVGTFLVFALSIAKIFGAIRDSMSDVLKLRGADTVKQVDEIKNSFEELKAAVANAFLPLIIAAIPYIKMALSWLIELFNRASMITAAFLGQKEALQIIQGSAQKIADANKKTEKAAKGQLAAFDQINVLQKQESGTKTENLPKVAAELVPITDEIIGKVQTIKEEISTWWGDVVKGFQFTWEFIKQWLEDAKTGFKFLGMFFAEIWDKVVVALWNNFIDTWALIFENTKETIERIKERVIQIFTGLKDFVHGIFTGDWALAWEGLKNIVAGVFGAVWELFNGMLINMSIALAGNINTLKILWGALQPIFGDTLDWVQSKFVSVFTGIQTFVQDVINNILGFINLLIGSIMSAMELVSGLNVSPGAIGGGTVTAPSTRVPRLATGAVIPPNASFAAILGDQRSGRNLEAPEGLIRQIIREELGNAGGQEINVPVTLTLDGEVLYKSNKRVSMRHGKNLISSGNT
jgi:hypothetical protein